MPAAVELSVNSDVMTGFCDSLKICRSMMASNCRLASAIFCCSVKCLLPARSSTGMLEVSTGDWMGAIFMSADNEFGLQCSRLFHGLKNAHHVARSHAERFQCRRHFFHCRQFR